MAQMLPHIKKQLAQLGKISAKEAGEASAVIVDIKIKELGTNDLQRALYLVGTSFIELTHKQKVIVDVIKNTQKMVEEVIENNELSREELIAEIRHLILEETKPVVQ